jgi:hypothetical protein
VANGLAVLVGSRNFERGEAAATEIGPSAIPLQLDVTDRVSIATAAERIRKEFGRLDLLVNNAAISNTRMGSLSLQEYAKITLALLRGRRSCSERRPNPRTAPPVYLSLLEDVVWGALIQLDDIGSRGRCRPLSIAPEPRRSPTCPTCRQERPSEFSETEDSEKEAMNDGWCWGKDFLTAPSATAALRRPPSSRDSGIDSWDAGDPDFRASGFVPKPTLFETYWYSFRCHFGGNCRSA